jgi:ABC-type lipoprotein release transport system permease subunit
MVAALAWRSLWRHRRRTLITVTTIGLGLASVVFFVALAEGVYHQLIEDAVRIQAGHVTLEHRDYRAAPAIDLRVHGVAALRARAGALPQAERTKLLVLGQGVARSGTAAAGVAVMGVEPAAETTTSPLARRIVAGTYLADGDGAWLVVGAVLAERLHLDVGSKLVLTTNDASGALVETLFRVRGIFRTGADEIDGVVVQAPLGAARRLFGLGDDEATQLGVVLRDSRTQRAALQALRGMLAPRDDVAVRTWQETLPELAAFIRLDRVSDRTFEGFLLLLTLVTGFNTLLMSVLERQREFAVQLALGTPPGLLRRQVLCEALMIGLLGCLAGLAVGGAVSLWVERHGWDLSRIYGTSGFTISGLAMSTRIHARVTFPLLAWLGGIVLGAVLLMSLVPVRRAARVPVADLLR